MLRLFHRVGPKKAWLGFKSPIVSLRALESFTRPDPTREVDFDDVLEKIDAGKVSAQEFGLILEKIAKNRQYQSAVDLYEKLPAEERYGGASPSRGVGLLNDNGIVTLIHCYNRIGKPAGFLTLCSSVADRRKYTPYVAEQMLECFADLDRLDMLEALLIGWFHSPSSLSNDLRGEEGDKDVETPDWNDALARTLKISNSAVEPSDDLNAFVDSLMARVAQRTSEKRAKKPVEGGTGYSRTSNIAGELLAQLDQGTLRGALPAVPVWKRIVAMYANRGAWQQCVHIACFCMSSTPKHVLEEEPCGSVAFALRAIIHHTVRALCKSGRHAQALDILDTAEKQLGHEVKRPATLALFLPYFHRNGSPAVIQDMLDEVLAVVSAYLDEQPNIKTNEIRSLLSSVVSLLCRRGYANEAVLFVEGIAEKVGLVELSGARRAILRPATLSMLVNACAMRGDGRAVSLFHVLKYREGPLARIMCDEGFNQAVNRAYHALHAHPDLVSSDLEMHASSSAK
jgi:hypothetical protein